MSNISRERRQRWVEQALSAIAGLAGEHRRLLSVPLMESRWHLLIDRGQPFPPSDRSAAFAVGPTGVFALVFTDVIPGEQQLRAIRGDAENIFQRIILGRRQFVPHSIELMLLLPRVVGVENQEQFLAVDPKTLRRTLIARDTVLPGKQPSLIVTEVSSRTNRFDLISTDNAPTVVNEETDGLFAPADVREPERNKLLTRPFQDWMIFLDPEQLSIVNRNYNGPARFSGPAGTGKSVVALHRMARFARQSPGRMLFTSFVKTLPTYHRSGFMRLVPQSEYRAEFTGLYAWTLRFLGERKVPFKLDDAAHETAFSLTWIHARDEVAKIVADNKLAVADSQYWKDELHRVIKGRGITTLEEYQAIERTGRNRIPLDDDEREVVWEHLYKPYQRRLRERGADDFNDVIDKAITELRARPLDEPYGLVVVDEVQDFTLVELQLVHQIAGGTPNAPLVLVGDGQQQVYPGGWRLSDAGIPIVGRGAVLRTNYRNRAAVHDYAKRIDATNIVDDLDGAPGFVLRDSDVVLPDGRAESVTVRRKDIDPHLVQAIAESGFPHSDIAVIVTTNKESEHFRTVLQRVGIPSVSLEHYDGTAQDKVKVGTVHRAKGMDFAAVFTVTDKLVSPTTELTGSEQDRAELAARQIMVAVTRARDYVWVGVVEG